MADNRAEIEALLGDVFDTKTDKQRLEELEIIPEALADLSVMVSDTVMSQEDMADAIADLSEIVSEMLGGE